jgi:hypothetical protein
MRLDDHRTADGESCRRIASSDRKRERKIARREHDGWAQRAQTRAHLWFRRISTWIGRVDALAGPGVLLRDVGKQTQLHAGPRALGRDSDGVQRSLSIDALDQLVAETLDAIGYCTKKLRTLAPRAGRVFTKRGGCRFRRKIYFLIHWRMPQQKGSFGSSRSVACGVTKALS